MGFCKIMFVMQNNAKQWVQMQMMFPHPPLQLFLTDPSDFFFSSEITRQVNPSDDPGSPDGDGGSLCNIHSLALALEQHVRPPFYF